jgi:hypothetical protein
MRERNDERSSQRPGGEDARGMPDVAVAEPAPETPDPKSWLQRSWLMAGAGIVVAAIVGVFLLAFVAILALWLGNVDADSIVSVMGAATSVIGTLVGAFLGLRVGQEGGQEAAQRAEAARRTTEQALVAALPHVPTERTDDILKAYTREQRP